MMRALMVTAVLVAGVVPPPPGPGRDGGSVLGRGDAGLPLDAGSGVVAEIVSSDGGSYLDPRGVSDRVTLSVGAALKLEFPRLVVESRCDAPVVIVEAKTEGLSLRGVKPGTTDCGFWYQQNAFPNRLVEVTVVPAADPPR